MDISEFIEVAKNLNVLGIKITKDDFQKSTRFLLNF